MTAGEYLNAIAKLGKNQEEAGVWLGVSARTGQNWAAKGPPEPVAKLLRLVLKRKIKPKYVK